MKLILLVSFFILVASCISDIEIKQKTLKRCKRQMAGCPGLRSGSGRCTGCHNGSGGHMGPRGCTGCSFRNSAVLQSASSLGAWHEPRQAPVSWTTTTRHIRPNWQKPVFGNTSPVIWVKGYWNKKPVRSRLASNSWKTSFWNKKPNLNWGWKIFDGYFTGKSHQNKWHHGNTKWKTTGRCKTC